MACELCVLATPGIGRALNRITHGCSAPGSSRDGAGVWIATGGRKRIHTLWTAFLLTAVVSCTGGLRPLLGQALQVTPDHVLVDEPATIRASGLEPNEHVFIRAELTDGSGEQWVSQAEFVSDAGGNLDTSKQAPAGGSYQEVSAMGLVWSMMPVDRRTEMYRAMTGGAPQDIKFTLLRNGAPVSTAELWQAMLAEGIQRVRLSEQGLYGVLFLPSANESRPGVLVLGGSEGGMPLARAAWLADRGYAALALAYFRFGDLPRDLAAIPLEYFERALNWMAQRPEIDNRRLAVMGTSRGAELALQLGSLFPQIRAVVAYAPANVRYPACCGNTGAPYAWTWQGKPLAFLSRRMREDPEAVVRATIAAERIHGPVLMISGEDDHVWNSSEMADDIAERLERDHFPYSFENMKYPHAGHAAGRPEIVPSWRGALRQPLSGQELDLGGSPEGDAESTLDAIPKVLAFLDKSLQQLPTQP